MLFGVRPDEQKRLTAAGEKVRVYVPYGDEWYGYLMRRLAERPANLAFFARYLQSSGDLEQLLLGRDQVGNRPFGTRPSQRHPHVLKE